MSAAPWEDPRSFGVYIHFPYCHTRCTYCDFVLTTSPRIPHEAYANAILRELQARAPAYARHRLVSIYLGGGTPSLWDPAQVARVVSTIRDTFAAHHPLEITLEANPEPAFKGRLTALLDAGVNRISLGVQTLHDAALIRLNRAHTAREARAVLEAVAKHPDRPRWSADLIYGLSGSTVPSALQDLQALIELCAPHLSLYELTVEPRTRLHRELALGRTTLPSEDAVADQAEALDAACTAAGLARYELSSLARPGHRALHNSLYWHMRPYLGLGAGAHSFEPANSPDLLARPGWLRVENPRVVRAYLATPASAGLPSPQDATELAKDALFTGLRWSDGVPWAHLKHWLSPAQIARARAVAASMPELVTPNQDRLQLSARGRRVANAVAMSLLEAMA